MKGRPRGSLGGRRGVNIGLGKVHYTSKGSSKPKEQPKQPEPEAATCADCGQKLEIVRPGKHQHVGGGECPALEPEPEGLVHALVDNGVQSARCGVNRIDHDCAPEDEAHCLKTITCLKCLRLAVHDHLTELGSAATALEASQAEVERLRALLAHHYSRSHRLHCKHCQDTLKTLNQSEQG